MFKNLTAYRIGGSGLPSATLMDSTLSSACFVPCGASQEKSTGWVPPRGEAHGALVESVNGQRILKLMIETKSVPGSLVREKAQEEADRIEAATGRKPGKKQMKELRDDALLILLPQAFPKRSSVLVWIDTAAGRLFTDASSQGAIDEVVTALVQSFNSLSLSLLHTAVSPQSAMTLWLLDAAPGDFTVERECELKSGDEEKSVVKFNRHNLVTDDVRKHITEGKLPTRLAMSYAGRVSFVLTESGQLKKIAFLEGVLGDRGDADNSFDGDVAITTGELQHLIPELVVGLGGEVEAS